MRGIVFILSGPSGVGKDAIRDRLKQEDFPITFCVTATTREPRPGEVHGVHYLFVSEDEFTRMEQRNELLERAVVHGQRYGIPRSQVRDGLERGLDLLITVDVQGGATLRRELPQAVSMFLAPPNIDALLPRLAIRGTETDEQKAVRLANAKWEMAQLSSYDYSVVNEQGRLDEAVDCVKAIITAERCRVVPALVTL